MAHGLQTLTEKEKQTLRLVVRGYDAKSLARRLGISVHTVNERLRHARRKLEVSSSREAARLLVAREEAATPNAPPADPDSLGAEALGAAPTGPVLAEEVLPVGTRPAWLVPTLIGAICLMSIILATLALTGFATQATTQPVPTEATSQSQAGKPAPDIVARDWLALVDAGNWDASWDATGAAFKQLNTSAKWAEVSQAVRPPLGAALSRELSSRRGVPTPPYGHEILEFRTRFANRADALETVALAPEGGTWRVVGYWIE